MGSHEDANKLLAYSFVASLIKKRKIKKARKFISEADKDDSVLSSYADMSFGEMQAQFENVLDTIENSPDIRENLVSTLRDLHKEGKDLNELYATEDIVDANYDTFKNLFME